MIVWVEGIGYAGEVPLFTLKKRVALKPYRIVPALGDYGAQNFSTEQEAKNYADDCWEEFLDRTGLAEEEPPPVGRVPSAPRSVTLKSERAGQLVATWDWPEDRGDPSELDFTVTFSPGGRLVEWDSGHFFVAADGFSQTTSYTATVVAKNATGQSPASQPSNAVTPGSIVVPPPPDPPPATGNKGPTGLNWPVGFPVYTKPKTHTATWANVDQVIANAPSGSVIEIDSSAGDIVLRSSAPGPVLVRPPLGKRGQIPTGRITAVGRNVLVAGFNPNSLVIAGNAKNCAFARMIADYLKIGDSATVIEDCGLYEIINSGPRHDGKDVAAISGYGPGSKIIRPTLAGMYLWPSYRDTSISPAQHSDTLQTYAKGGATSVDGIIDLRVINSVLYGSSNAAFQTEELRGQSEFNNCWLGQCGAVGQPLVPAGRDCTSYYAINGSTTSHEALALINCVVSGSVRPDRTFRAMTGTIVDKTKKSPPPALASLSSIWDS